MIQATIEDATKGAKLYYKSKYSDEYIEIIVNRIRDESFGIYISSTRGVHYRLDELKIKS